MGEYEIYEGFEPKDPDEVLDYTFDFKCATNETNLNGESDVLADGETIATKTVTAESGLTVDSSSLTDSNTSVTVWLSGGTDGTDYKVECGVVTSGSRTYSRSALIRVRER